MIGRLPTRNLIGIAGAAVAFLLVAALWFALQSSEARADDHGEEEAIIESCEASKTKVARGESVTIEAKVRNRSAGLREADLFVRFFYSTPRSSPGYGVHDSTTSEVAVSKGSSHTFRDSYHVSSNATRGEWTVTCTLYWKFFGSNRLQHNTTRGGHPSHATFEVRRSAPPDYKLSIDPPPSSINLGESFDLSVRIHNVSGFGDNSGITVSFPGFRSSQLRLIESSLQFKQSQCRIQL